MMSELDGWSVCRRIRKTSNIPVIMLTARADEDDTLLGFELGADDYVTKPFSPPILLARAKRLLESRYAIEEETNGNSLSSCGIHVDFPSRTVKVDGKDINLTYTEFEILTYLMHNQGIVITREQLITKIWGYEFSGDDRTVNSHIRNLRTKLGDKSKCIFKQYYANRKVDDIKTGIQSFEQAYLNAGEDVQTIEKLEQNFHREHGTWITTLDSLGNIKHINDFYLEIKLDPFRDKTFSDRVIKIPLYSFMNLKDIQKKKEYITKGARFTIFGIKKDTIIAPWKLLIEGGLFSIENNQLTSRLDGLPQEYFKENTMDLSGKITKVQLLEENAAPNHIYTNHMFIERIKEFQANLILNENNPGFNSLQVLDYEENGSNINC